VAFPTNNEETIAKHIDLCKKIVIYANNDERDEETYTKRGSGAMQGRCTRRGRGMGRGRGAGRL